MPRIAKTVEIPAIGELDRNAGQLSLPLAQALRAAIHKGELKAGELLPSTRVLTDGWPPAPPKPGWRSARCRQCTPPTAEKAGDPGVGRLRRRSHSPRHPKVESGAGVDSGPLSTRLKRAALKGNATLWLAHFSFRVPRNARRHSLGLISNRDRKRWRKDTGD